MFRKNSIFVLIIMISATMLIYGCSSQSSGNEQNTDSNYPEKPIEIVVGYGQGGGTDNFARSISEELEDVLDVNINVVNKEGSTGAVALDYVQSQPSDGYTLLAVSDHPTSAATGIYDYEIDDIKPIARLQNDVRSISVKGDGKYSSMEDLLSDAKENPEELRIGGVGSTGSDEFAVKNIEENEDIDVNYVSFGEAGKMHAALLGDSIDAMVERISTIHSQVENGDIDPVLLMNKERLDDFSDVPVTGEDFGWDKISDGNTRGIVAKKDTPEDIVKTLEDALKEAKEKPDYKNYLEESFLDINPGWKNSKEYDEEMHERYKQSKEMYEKYE